jgi:guanyl-specific ribonuclease Sa
MAQIRDRVKSAYAEATGQVFAKNELNFQRSAENLNTQEKLEFLIYYDLSKNAKAVPEKQDLSKIEPIIAEERAIFEGAASKLKGVGKSDLRKSAPWLYKGSDQFKFFRPEIAVDRSGNEELRWIPTPALFALQLRQITTFNIKVNGIFDENRFSYSHFHRAELRAPRNAEEQMAWFSMFRDQQEISDKSQVATGGLHDATMDLTILTPAGAFRHGLGSFLSWAARVGREIVRNGVAWGVAEIAGENFGAAGSIGAQIAPILVSMIRRRIQGRSGSNGTNSTVHVPTSAPAGKTSLAVLGNSCFVAGTTLLTDAGEKPIEQFQVGDRILSRPQDNPEAPNEIRLVEETFVRVAPVLDLRVNGHNIRTTAEHPFYVRGKGWICAKELQLGDALSSHDGEWVAVEAVRDLNEVATVYNLRVSDYHTYFVGSREWGFSVWAHNANYEVVHYGGGWYRIRNTTTNQFVNGTIDSAGNFVPGGSTPLRLRGPSGNQTLQQLAGQWNALSAPRTFPQHATDTLGTIRRTNAPPAGYRGGGTFANDGRGGGQVLPRTTSNGTPITYREFDVHAHTPGVNRGAERIVVGSDGRAYYTSDHYGTFTEMQ